PAAKEALSEGAGQLPISEPVFGFSRGNLRRASARVPEGGRKPRSAPAAFQDHRRKGHRRSAHHFGRLPARIHPKRSQRRHHPRAVANLFRQLIRCLLALSGVACGAGPVDHEPAPVGVALIGAQPYPGQGTDCLPGDSDACGVPIDGDIILRFDRYLRPSTAVRQSIVVYTGSPVNGIGFLRPEYDVVERVVVYRLTAPLEPGTLYTLELLTPGDTSRFGFQAFDGGRLEPRGLPLKFTFVSRRSREPSERVPLEPVPSCERVVEILRQAGCAAAHCHAGERGSMGLRLESPSAFAGTAIGQVAHQPEI